MSLLKQTVIVGFKGDEFRCSILHGHWKDETLRRFAERCKIDLRTVIFHRDVTNTSLLGSGEIGPRFEFDENQQAVKLEEETEKCF
tara:strand:+ start:1463 stop:1720 length:258 start_codon:yes stop_codon:yes gene_type:complete